MHALASHAYRTHSYLWIGLTASAAWKGLARLSKSMRVKNVADRPRVDEAIASMQALLYPDDDDDDDEWARME